MGGNMKILVFFFSNFDLALLLKMN